MFSHTIATGTQVLNLIGTNLLAQINEHDGSR